MNKWEKEVLESLLDSEEEVLKELEKQYQKALNQIGEKIKLFQSDLEMLNEAMNADGLDDAAKNLLLSQSKSKIYQKQYQEALYGQISGILDQMHGSNYQSIDEYLKKTYEDSYIGTQYDLANQGIPVITPINQAQVTQAVLLDSKVVKGFYDRLGVDVDKLKKVISQEVSRGIASAMSYSDIARNINNVSRTGLYNAQRIARTEGHRIQNTASRDAANEAKAHGADIVKIWDSTLDGKTRESHRMVDGEIRELDEKFSNGLDRPGDPSGAASEVINCRCVEIHKPRWALEDGFVKMDNFTGELRTFESPKDYEDFKKKYWSKENQEYMKYVQDLETKYGTKKFETVLGSMSNQEYQHFKKLEDASPMWKEKERQFGILYGDEAIHIDKAYIHGNAYKSKFGTITDNAEANDSIYETSRTILDHRDGTEYEDMYLLDTNGNIISSVTNSSIKSGIIYTDEFREKLNECIKNGTQTIAIHNHPQGTPPSPDDFKKAFENHYTTGVIVGHNGQIYVYSNNNVEISINLAGQMASDIAFFYQQGMDIDRASELVYNGYGLSYTVISSGD